MLANFVIALALEIFLWELLMKQPFKDENVVSGNNEIIEIYMNDVIMKKESVQIETSKNREK